MQRPSPSFHVGTQRAIPALELLIGLAEASVAATVGASFSVCLILPFHFLTEGVP